MISTDTAREAPDHVPGSAIFERLAAGGYEQVLFCHDAHTGLRSIIAIHDTTLGPALGGVRMWPYESEDAALEDCLRLAKGMTLKAAAAGVNLGGGKSVIIGDPARDKTEALLRAHGRFIATLGGRYIPGIDVGTGQADLEIVGLEAGPVSCVKGDPSPMTALGVLEAMRACLRATGGDGAFAGVRVAVQGLGHVGASLAGMLAAESADLVVADLDPRRAADLGERLGARVVASRDILGAECDVLAPCALGGVIDDETLPELRCRIVAGAANNVLAAPEHGVALDARGILYAPDFCANAGGLISLEEEILGHDRDRSERRVRRVGDLVAGVIERARRDGIPTSEAAVAEAEARLRSLARVGPAYVGRRAPLTITNTA